VTRIAPEAFEGRLRDRLRGARRIAVVGIGDELRRADRLGMLAARAIDAAHRRGVRVFLAGTVPESLTAPIRRFRPDRILMIDAADLGAEPGTVALLDPGRTLATGLSTHALPLSVVAAYLQDSSGAPVTLVGIQPDLATTQATPTAAERRGLHRIVAGMTERRPRGHAAPPARRPHKTRRGRRG
jgi:hydrogenase 3 maturation protease